eukprot:6188295-Pleurochrysis_carterae.AAC.4
MAAWTAQPAPGLLKLRLDFSHKLTSHKCITSAALELSCSKQKTTPNARKSDRDSGKHRTVPMLHTHFSWSTPSRLHLARSFDDSSSTLNRASEARLEVAHALEEEGRPTEVDRRQRAAARHACNVCTDQCSLSSDNGAVCTLMSSTKSQRLAA